MSFSFESVSFSDLLKNDNFEVLMVAKTEIERRVASLRNERIASLKQRVAEQAALLGVTPAQLFEPADAQEIDFSPANKASKTGVPKYRDLATGGTWSGKGKPPAWMKAHLTAGGSKEDLLIRAVEA